jgi:hypothetical protein
LARCKPPLPPPGGLRCLCACQQDHVARRRSPVEVSGPRLEQLAALARELRAVVRRPDLVDLPVRQAGLDDVGAGRGRFVRPGAGATKSLL